MTSVRLCLVRSAESGSMVVARLAPGLDGWRRCFCAGRHLPKNEPRLLIVSLGVDSQVSNCCLHREALPVDGVTIGPLSAACASCRGTGVAGAAGSLRGPIAATLYAQAQPGNARGLLALANACRVPNAAYPSRRTLAHVLRGCLPA